MAKTLDPKVREQVLDVLNQVFSDRYHSLAEYAIEACPYIAPSDKDLLQHITEMGAYDRAESERLADIIEAIDGVPQVQPYSHRFAEMNYLSLDYVRTFLLAQLEEQIEQYEAALPNVEAIPEAAFAVLGVCREIRSRLDGLRAVTAAEAAN